MVQMRVAIKELSGILLVGRHRAVGWTKTGSSGRGGQPREPGL